MQYGGWGTGDKKASKSVNRPEFRIYVMVSVIINLLETGLYTLWAYGVVVSIRNWVIHITSTD